MSICAPCQRGNHQHDRWARGPLEGEDAGCPAAVDGGECGCLIRIPAQQVPRCAACGQRIGSDRSIT